MALAVWAVSAFVSTLIGSLILLAKPDWTRYHIWRILAFGSGVLLGVTFMHILPEANSLAPHWAGIGVATSFLLIFAIEGFTMMHSCLEYAEDCHIHAVKWSAFGALSLHSLIDGMAIAVAFHQNPWLGTVVSGAILVHKFIDGLTLTGLLLSSHYTREHCLKTVSILALATPLGAFLFLPLAPMISGSVLGWLFGFIAGIFFYVGAADIIPRLHKVKDVYCLGSFALGLVFGGLHW